MRRAIGVLLLSSIVLMMPLVANAETASEREARLQAELRQIEAQIAEQQTYLAEKQKERTSLERDVAILDSQIQKAQLSIRASDVAISSIDAEIDDKEAGIVEVNSKVAAGQASLAQLLRLTRQSDDTSLVELVLSGTFTDFFEDLDAFATLQSSLDSSFQEMTVLKDDLMARKIALEEKQREEQEYRSLRVLEKQDIESKEAQKQKILKDTKGQEAAYQKLIAGQQQTAAQIRAALFSLRDSSDISFGQAYEYAKKASEATGVRTAFILGILQTETNLGQNVGQCLLTNSPVKGNGIGKNTGTAFSRVMHPTRDVDLYLSITSELGIDWRSQVVSCPQSVGYGGAMGPAQFIPSTWKSYKDRVARAMGQSLASPWNPQTAFMASAMFLSDLGASRGTRASEMEAAGRYYAGGNWNSSLGRGYASKVLGYADNFEAQIAILEG